MIAHGSAENAGGAKQPKAEEENEATKPFSLRMRFAPTVQPFTALL